MAPVRSSANLAATGPYAEPARVSLWVEETLRFDDSWRAIAALEGDQQCVKDIAATYQSRRDVLARGLHEAGWKVDVSRDRASALSYIQQQVGAGV